ncbi:endonuclease MutS2 [Atopobacter phocae]|uniref:endonuclease MutS2 n=1 Tax=Atopobacter phocae TaxID=136492 RepID=UPI000472752F|nr:hypothetical protein [Atopobacter phocae]
MTNELYQTIDFEQIRSNVKQYAISGYAKKEIESRQPSPHLNVVEKRLDETGEALTLLNRHLVMPFMGLTDIERLTEKVEKGFVLSPSELIAYADFLRSIRLIKQFLMKHEWLVPRLATYATSLGDFSAIERDIDEKVINNQIRDEASKELKKTRQRLDRVEDEINQKLKKFLKDSRYKEYIQERIVVQKQERYTVPIKHSYKNKVPGQIIEESSKGLTVYIEPDVIQALTEERVMLKEIESTEEFYILSLLTGEIGMELERLHQMIEIIVEFDVIFARAKYAREIDGRRVSVNKNEYIKLVQAKHPLLGQQAVPLSLEMGQDYRVLMITGANAGGKTVVLKTVALLTVMTMYGLFIPCDEASHIAVMDHVFASIGDQQSLENSLSTFSGHLKQMSTILRQSTRHTLIVLDEIGSGTDPRQGAGLAVAIINALYQSGAIVFASTHYGELKEYARLHADFETAAMDFNLTTLQPTYRLLIGQSGESYAFWLAEKMGVLPQVIEEAQSFVLNNQYPLEVHPFEHKQKKEPEKEHIAYQKGDKVWANDLKKEGIIYEVNSMQRMAHVFIDQQMHEVPLKRLQLLLTAKELYPAGYNLDLLFVTNYDQYKLEKDLLRGSKKAWKQLKKKGHYLEEQ